MRVAIEQEAADRFVVTVGDRAPIVVPTLAAAAAVVAAAGPALTAAAALPERWESVEGIAFSEPTGDGRDFTRCAWSWRTPGESLLPLMFQRSTQPGHYAAELAGFIERLDVAGGAVTASGSFYASPVGRDLRDTITAGGLFGVSVDPGQVTAEFTCTEWDEDDWGEYCTDGVLEFAAYQIIGLTATPFPAFARAAIRVAAADAAAAVPAAVVVAAVAPPQAPHRSVFFAAEEDYADLAIPQPAGPDGGTADAVPLTVFDDGRVVGHLAYWGQCHTGFPGQCVSPPASATYDLFHTGMTVTDDGEEVATGVLTIGCDHADVGLFAADARDHYANTGLAWADVRAANGALGVWVTGVVRPLTDEQLRVVRASSLSGDWRVVDGRWEMVAALSVNAPGFPVRRALAASGQFHLGEPSVVFASDSGVVSAATGLNVVRRCKACGAAAHAGDAASGEMLEILRRLDTRTRHLTVQAEAFYRGRIRKGDHPV